MRSLQRTLATVLAALSLMKPIALIAVSTVAFGAVAAAANLVVGGDFENPVIPPGNSYQLDVTPTGWTGIGDLTVQGYAGSVSSGNGNQWFDLNPDTSAGTGISQSFNLNAGTTYAFSFLYDGGGGGTTTQISYSLHTLSGTLLSGSVSTAGLNVYAGTPWSTFSTTFTPSVDASETLSFVPNGVYSGGFIDNVQLYAVPEPGTLLLLVSGLAGLAAVGARRRRV